MPFNCSYRNKNEPSAIYPSFGYSPSIMISNKWRDHLVAKKGRSSPPHKYIRHTRHVTENNIPPHTKPSKENVCVRSQEQDIQKGECVCERGKKHHSRSLYLSSMSQRGHRFRPENHDNQDQGLVRVPRGQDPLTACCPADLDGPRVTDSAPLEFSAPLTQVPTL
jgi:hypothetical protein